mmetsp:Transcript_30/g.79  ORF Transcript_30/g.79 Transcript_30/m.79 type:complete len:308 (+) Transcript_30:768-1691(+)
MFDKNPWRVERFRCQISRWTSSVGPIFQQRKNATVCATQRLCVSKARPDPPSRLRHWNPLSAHGHCHWKRPSPQPEAQSLSTTPEATTNCWTRSPCISSSSDAARRCTAPPSSSPSSESSDLCGAASPTSLASSSACYRASLCLSHILTVTVWSTFQRTTIAFRVSTISSAASLTWIRCCQSSKCQAAGSRAPTAARTLRWPSSPAGEATLFGNNASLTASSTWLRQSSRCSGAQSSSRGRPKSVSSSAPSTTRNGSANCSWTCAGGGTRSRTRRGSSCTSLRCLARKRSGCPSKTSLCGRTGSWRA